VLQGSGKPEVLQTYDAERRIIALELIELDRRTSDFYSMGRRELSQGYAAFRGRFSGVSSGVDVIYGPELLVDGARKASQQPAGLGTRPELATGIQFGARIPSHEVVCQADVTVHRLLDLLPSNGKWRVLIFAGNVLSPLQNASIQSLGGALHIRCKDVCGTKRTPALRHRNPAPTLRLRYRFRLAGLARSIPSLGWRTRMALLEVLLRRCCIGRDGLLWVSV